MSRRALRITGPPLAGAAALLACGLLLGIDPLVALLVGGLVWAGAHLLWPVQPLAAPSPDGPSASQREHLDRAEVAVAEIHALLPGIETAGVALPLGEIAGRASAWIERVRSDPRQFGLYRKPLGSYLAQAADLARRFREAEARGRADPATVARTEATFGRLVRLYEAVEARGASDAALDLDARIAVLEAEVEAELAGRTAGAGRDRG